MLILNFTQFHSFKKNDISVTLLAQADHLLKLGSVTNKAGCIVSWDSDVICETIFIFLIYINMRINLYRLTRVNKQSP